MDAAILAKVNNWLNGNYDQETKNEIIRLQKENPDELIDRSLSEPRIRDRWAPGHNGRRNKPD